MKVKKDKPAATPPFHDEILAKTVARSEANIRTAKELLEDSKRAPTAQEIIADGKKLRGRFRSQR
jgi:hypothetical protein